MRAAIITFCALFNSIKSMILAEQVCGRGGGLCLFHDGDAGKCR